MESLTITQFIAGQVEALLYDKLHQLLGLIAEDYELSHGELVEKYLVYQNKVESPKFIYKSTGVEDTEVEEVVKPKKAPARKAKVTQKAAKEAKAEEPEEARDGKCQAVTAKGLPCKNKGFGGTCFCRVHTKKDESEVKPKKTRGKALSEEAEKPEPKKRGRKPKKAQPQHSHKLDEESEDCDLCETHGNPLKEAQEFEVSESDIKREALREIMKEELGVDEVTDEMLEEFENSMELEDKEEVLAPKSFDEQGDEALDAIREDESEGEAASEREEGEAASEREEGEVGEEEFE
jgi:hypothetical protein